VESTLLVRWWNNIVKNSVTIQRGSSYHKKKMINLLSHVLLYRIPYSRKVWQEESLVNLANREQFAKLKPSKFLLIIITFWLNLFIRQTFFHLMLKTSKFAKLYAHQTFLLYSSDEYWLNYLLFILCLCVFQKLCSLHKCF